MLAHQEFLGEKYQLRSRTAISLRAADFGFLNDLASGIGVYHCVARCVRRTTDRGAISDLGAGYIKSVTLIA